MNSIEICQRKLGDYLFMVQDYSEAINVYKTLSRDVQNEKSSKYYAAVCEIYALANYLIDPSRKYHKKKKKLFRLKKKK